jgi:hypothetical protein
MVIKNRKSDLHSLCRPLPELPVSAFKLLSSRTRSNMLPAPSGREPRPCRSRPAEGTISSIDQNLLRPKRISGTQYRRAVPSKAPNLFNQIVFPYTMFMYNFSIFAFRRCIFYAGRPPSRLSYLANTFKNQVSRDRRQRQFQSRSTLRSNWSVQISRLKSPEYHPRGT